MCLKVMDLYETPPPHSGPLLVVRGGLALLDLLPLCIIHFWNRWLKLDKMGVILTHN